MKAETRREVEEGLRAAHELLAFLWNNVDENGEGGSIEITASDSHAESLAALMTDARERVSLALEALELDQ